MKFRLTQKVYFAKRLWIVVEAFDGQGSPSPSTITLRLLDKLWYTVFSSLPHEVVVGESRFAEVSPFQ